MYIFVNQVFKCPIVMASISSYFNLIWKNIS